jgi:hypothetical protein
MLFTKMSTFGEAVLKIMPKRWERDYLRFYAKK